MLPDYAKQMQGTAIVWGVSGASVMGMPVTKVMSLNGLASGSGRNGIYADLGANFEMAYAVWVVAETGTAPADGLPVEVYFACSPVNTVFPGKATGADDAYSAVPSAAANKLQIGGIPFLLTATADTNTVLVQYAGEFRPQARYVAPVYINGLGVALRTEATALDNTSGIVLVPILTAQVE